MIQAFWALSTERYIGWAPGYIPQHRIDEHAVRKGVAEGMMALFVAAVRACDDEYLSWVGRKRQAAAQKQE